MNDKIAIHPKTNKTISLLISKPVGSILIVGAVGSGKNAVATKIALKLMPKISTSLDNYPYFMLIKRREDKQEISIEAIREIIEFIKLKVPGSGLRRTILIENAQLLSHEAQNALLKILEEPQEDTIFILTTPYEQSLLPTIVSRCQKIKIYPVTKKQASDFYKGKISPAELESAWRLSRGLASLLDSLVNKSDTHPLRQAVEKSKQFLAKPKAERIQLINGLSREEMKLFLDALAKVLAALYYSAQQNSKPTAKKLLTDRNVVQQVIQAYELNANQRLSNLKLLTGINI
ncbi:MAG TPA: AAA family ATPase [Gammaproteobacteria bacterium]|nr:AAA family ATPase [Gammaproteobacteria bacterium]